MPTRLLRQKLLWWKINHLNAPSLPLYDKTTGEIVDNGLIVSSLSDSAVNAVEVVVEPRGLTGSEYGLAPLQTVMVFRSSKHFLM